MSSLPSSRRRNPEGFSRILIVHYGAAWHDDPADRASMVTAQRYQYK
jgi:hypothetical protein